MERIRFWLDILWMLTRAHTHTPKKDIKRLWIRARSFNTANTVVCLSMRINNNVEVWMISVVFRVTWNL